MKINIIFNFIVNIDLCVERMYCLLCVKIKEMWVINKEVSI